MGRLSRYLDQLEPRTNCRRSVGCSGILSSQVNNCAGPLQLCLAEKRDPETRPEIEAPNSQSLVTAIASISISNSGRSNCFTITRVLKIEAFPSSASERARQHIKNTWARCDRQKESGRQENSE